jgi:predicted nucleotidyltransferase
LTSSEVEYLVIGGYAVNYHGFSRATGDLDIWIHNSQQNANRLTEVVRQFGFANAKPDDFLQPGKIVRMGVPPVRLEILTSISGVDFQDCYTRRIEVDWDGVQVPIIHRDDLIKNKQASGRLKDRLDLEQLS